MKTDRNGCWGKFENIAWCSLKGQYGLFCMRVHRWDTPAPVGAPGDTPQLHIKKMGLNEVD